MLHLIDSVVLLDIRSPDNPRRLGSFQTWGEADDVAIDWPLIYVADHTVGLQNIDASDPSNPRRIGRYGDVGITRSVDVAGRHAYLTDDGQGLQIIDASDPAHPFCVARFITQGYATKVRVRHPYAYVSIGNGVEIVDVGNSSVPRHVSMISTSGDVKDIALGLQRAYITTSAWNSGSFRLHIIDVSDPAQPQTVGYYSSSLDAASNCSMSRTPPIPSDSPTCHSLAIPCASLLHPPTPSSPPAMPGSLSSMSPIPRFHGRLPAIRADPRGASPSMVVRPT
jgi:hypothetical protein